MGTCWRFLDSELAGTALGYAARDVEGDAGAVASAGSAAGVSVARTIGLEGSVARGTVWRIAAASLGCFPVLSGRAPGSAFALG